MQSGVKEGGHGRKSGERGTTEGTKGFRHGWREGGGGQLIDCAECWRLEERGMRRGGKGKENRRLNPSLGGRKRE